MPYHLLADTVVILHLAFIVFAVAGGILIVWWRKVIWIHIPAVIWAAWIEFSGGLCPLTYLENWLLGQSGSGGYHGDFTANYILPVVYPANLTRKIQITMAAIVIVLNVLVYGLILMYKKNKSGFKFLFLIAVYIG
jgi:hypothetical protein